MHHFLLVKHAIVYHTILTFSLCVRYDVCSTDDFPLHRDARYDDVLLVMVGSTRNKEDNDLVSSLKADAASMGLTDHVTFVINAPFSELYQWLGTAQIGLHTMWNEHFGISIVEMMAAGLVTVAHKSGGPLMDLIVPAAVSTLESHPDAVKNSTGYLATTATEYAGCMAVALDTYQQSSMLRERARAASMRFSDEDFQKVVCEEFSVFLN